MAKQQDATNEAKQEAIRKMKEAQAKMAEREKESTQEQAEINKTAGKEVPKPKKETEGKKQFEEIKDKDGVIMLRKVKVYSPFQTYFDNPAYSVSAINGTGPFDVLPGHKNFLSLLLPGEVIVRTDRDEEKLKIDRGIMHVHDDAVTVFLDV